MAHELVRPLRLHYDFARQELCQNWLDVEHGRTVDGVQLCHHQARALAPKNAAYGGANAVWPVLPALRKDADGRPVLVVPRMAGASDNSRGLDLVEEKDDLSVGEVAEALERLVGEAWH